MVNDSYFWFDYENKISMRNDENKMCNFQTNEYELQAVMSAIICTYHRLHINNVNNKCAKIEMCKDYKGRSAY